MQLSMESTEHYVISDRSTLSRLHFTRKMLRDKYTLLIVHENIINFFHLIKQMDRNMFLKYICRRHFHLLNMNKTMFIEK